MSGLPLRLRAALEADSEPVRPLWPPLARAIAVAVPVLMVLGAGAIFARADVGTLAAISGPSWWVAVVQWAVAVGLLWFAMREAVPGSGLGAFRAALALAAAVGIHVATAASLAVGDAPPGATLSAGLRCLTGEATLALPHLAVIAFLVTQALPVRAGWAGALAGTAAGILADSIWHLLCPRFDLAHLLVWHVGAAVSMGLLGALVGASWARWRWARGR